MLTRNHRQEGMSRAYIQAVAACAGMSCGGRDFDYGIDLCVHDVTEQGGRYRESGARIDIQAKSTTVIGLTATHVVYDSEATSYDLLREVDVVDARILILLVLPSDEADWFASTEGETLLRRCAYWMSLRGMPATRNTSTVRVSIPRSNLLTPTSLTAMMERVKKKEPL